MARTIVVKVGGGEGISLEHAAESFADLVATGARCVLVHGGSHETNVLSVRLGIPPKTITSPSGNVSRRTDRATLDAFLMAYCGKVNKTLVAMLRARTVDAIGLSGIDGGLWHGERKAAIRSVEHGRTVIVRDDLSGRVTGVDAGLLNLLLDAGRIPVLTPPAITDDGVAINVDADRAAAATAAALGADELLLLSNVPGVLRDPADLASLIGQVGEGGIEDVRNAASGRMKNKVLAAEEALAGGVSRVVIGSARGTDAIELALAGAGTIFEEIWA
ncbi:MAG: putative acetylglutamate kinase-like protein [Phycisphaeraceae bacterium]|nr:MAG: putative acetylglutamate kinase-like protein [Phycisphaeraceae bacterium]